MDYSKFYLKNYVPREDDVKDDDQNPRLRIETRSQPEIIYINPDGEEFDPETEVGSVKDKQNAFQRNESPDENIYIPQSEHENSFAPQVIRKQQENRPSFANKFCQTVLIFAIVIMSLIVSADFITDGKAIAALTNAVMSDKIEYYAVLSDPSEDTQSAIAKSYSVRLKGGAGFIVKNGQSYYNVFELYDNRDDAEEYMKNNGGEIITLSTEYYDNISGDLKNYADYPVKTCEQLNAVLASLTAKEITSQQALEKLTDVKEDFAVLYDNMNNASKTDEDNAGLALLANASVALSALESLCDQNATRPNLACGIRYAVCQIMFTYCYSE